LKDHSELTTTFDEAAANNPFPNSQSPQPQHKVILLVRDDSVGHDQALPDAPVPALVVTNICRTQQCWSGIVGFGYDAVKPHAP